MRIVVLGGSGFIGVNVVDNLCARGHTVKVFDRQKPRFYSRNRRADHVLGDWNDQALVRDVLKGAEMLVDLVWTMTPAAANRDIVGDISNNVIPTIRLLRSCVTSDVRRVLFASSGGGVYGPTEQLPIPESHPTHPISAHAVTKLMIEEYLGLFHRQFGVEFGVLRIGNPYGEGQSTDGDLGAVGVFMGNIARGEQITVWGDGSVIRDYVYVRDVARAFGLLAESPIEAGIFNIGTGVGTSLKELIAEIANVTNTSPAVKYTSAREYDVPANILDIELAKGKLGWEPEVDLEEGLYRTWNWILSIVDETACWNWQ
jgi:UDP-glucose 4-epimerase